MADRNALVIINGQIQELPSGDSLVGGGSGQGVTLVRGFGEETIIGPDLTFSDGNTNMVSGEASFVDTPVTYTGEVNPDTLAPIWRFADITHNQKNGFDWDVSFLEDTEISFSYMNSSEVGFDFMYVYLDGVEVFKSKNQTNLTWFTESFTVPSGDHTIRFYYTKDNSTDTGDDTVYVSGLGYLDILDGPYNEMTFIEYKKSIYLVLETTNDNPETSPEKFILYQEKSPTIGRKFWRWTFTTQRLTTIGYITPDTGTVGAYTQADVTYGPVSNAFDGSSNNFWGFTATEASEGKNWVQIEYSEPKWIENYSITSRSGSGSQGPDGWVLSYSEDGINWVDAHTVTGEPTWSNSTTRDFINPIDKPTQPELLDVNSKDNNKTLRIHDNKIIATSDNNQQIVSAASTVTDDYLSGGVVKKVQSASELVITIPTGLVNKEVCTFIQDGFGKISFVADVGVTLKSADNYKKTRTAYSSATLIPDKDVEDNYYIVGDLIE